MGMKIAMYDGSSLVRDALEAVVRVSATYLKQ